MPRFPSHGEGRAKHRLPPRVEGAAVNGPEASQAVASIGAAWRPLLSGGEAWWARRVTCLIADTLVRPEVISVLPSDLQGGLAGLALLHGYLSLVEPGSSRKESTQALLERMAECAATEELSPGLFEGFPGLGWVLDHLQAHVFGGAEDYNASVDALLLQYFDRPSSAMALDLVKGVTGLGVYGLGRGPLGAGRRIAASAVRALAKEARRLPPGVAWHAAPELIPAWRRAIHPEGYYDLGLSHGAPGVIVFLTKAYAADIEAERALDLLEGAVNWMLDQEIEGPGRLRFPRGVGAAGPEPARYGASWCYGDLGIAVALLGAARRVGRADWASESLRLARHAAARSPSEVQMPAAGLCHGAAGAMHLFNRLYQATGDPAFRCAAQAWFLQLQGLWEEEAGHFRGLESPAYPDAPPWRCDAGLLVGIAGIGLALGAAYSSQEPRWDECLLVDIPSAGKNKSQAHGIY